MGLSFSGEINGNSSDDDFEEGEDALLTFQECILRARTDKAFLDFREWGADACGVDITLDDEGWIHYYRKTRSFVVSGVRRIGPTKGTKITYSLFREELLQKIQELRLEMNDMNEGNLL